MSVSSVIVQIPMARIKSVFGFNSSLAPHSGPAWLRASPRHNPTSSKLKLENAVSCASQVHLEPADNQCIHPLTDILIMMFSSTFAARSSQRSPLAAYTRVEVESQLPEADPHRLILMLMDGFLDTVAKARGGLQQGDIPVKGEAICKAVRIVDEGLKCALDREKGGQLANDLDALYAYIIERLTLANATNNDLALQECADLLRPVRDAWLAITPPRSSGLAS